MTRRPPMPIAARVAEKVMGWSKCRDRDCKGCDNSIYCDPDGWHVNRPDSATPWDPAANHTDLLDVIEEMRGRGFDCEIAIEPWGTRVRFGWNVDRFGSRAERAVKGDWRSALARAVCRAALEAVR